MGSLAADERKVVIITGGTVSFDIFRTSSHNPPHNPFVDYGSDIHRAVSAVTWRTGCTPAVTMSR